jgi:hypothetical protein
MEKEALGLLSLMTDVRERIVQQRKIVSGRLGTRRVTLTFLNTALNGKRVTRLLWLPVSRAPVR